MKLKLIISFLLIIAVLCGVTLTKAKGIRIYKKDGTIIDIPYAALDRITTYNSNQMPIKTFEVNGVTFNMVFVKGGSFEMGATAEQSKRYAPQADEKPVHTVTLSDYYIGETEVTQELWYAVMKASPSSSNSWTSRYGLGRKYPAYFISYTECQEFINKLNNITGAAFRMPTEAEWEYAARGGDKSDSHIFSGDDIIDNVAWYQQNSDYHSHEVGTKMPNELGIYDMSGNICEWCLDWYDDYSNTSQINPSGPSIGSSRVLRGGYWIQGPTHCRIAKRDFSHPDYGNNETGLRLAL